VKRIRSTPGTSPRARTGREQGSSLGYVAAVGVDVLTEHRQFDHAARGEHGRLVDHVLHWSTDLLAAHRGNDAVGARMSQPVWMVIQAAKGLSRTA